MAEELLCQVSDVTDAWPQFAALPTNRQTALIARASEKLIKHCRRPGFIQQSVTATISGRNGLAIWLERRPIISVQSVTLNGEVLANTLGSGWTFNPRTGKLVRGSGQDDTRFVPWWSSGENNIIVQYWGGYPAVPDPVIEACVWTVKWMSDQARISGIYESESIGDYTYTLRTGRPLPMGLPDHIAALVADYVQDDAF